MINANVRQDKRRMTIIKRFTTSGKNLEDVQEMNRSLVIRLLHRMKLCSRADLAKKTGLKQATITNIISDLIKYGLVYETGIIEGEKGRRSIGISLNSTEYKVIGIRLARKYISIGLFDIGGTLYEVKEVPIDTVFGPEVAFQKMKDLIKDFITRVNKGTVIGIGLGIPGPFYRSEGRIVLMTEFPGWERILIQDEIQSLFGMPVYVEHDANCGVLAEWWYGPHHRDHVTMIYIAAGQGIGAGVIIDGRLYRGSLGTAGEIGHMSIAYDGSKCQCGNSGCLEMYCSTIVLINEIRKELKNNPDSILNRECSMKTIAEAIKSGDKLAEKAVFKVAELLGVGLANIVNAYNPDVIIIGDDLIQVGQPLLDIVRKTVKERTLPDINKSLKIELSSFECDPVLIGASALAIERILQNPDLTH